MTTDQRRNLPQNDAERAVARAICAETCAAVGEQPCYAHSDDQGKPLPWPAPACDEPGCIWLARAALAALPSQAQADGWQDIASAPTDEKTWFLTYVPPPGWYSGVTVNRRDGDGWWRSCLAYPPTHWRPLPAPPAIIAEKREGGS
jgi:hypothetical protein